MIIRVSKDSLEMSHIMSLINKECSAIVIENFIPKETIQYLLERITNSPLKNSHSLASQFKKIGPAYTEVSTEEQRKTYHDESIFHINRFRKIASPYISPIDELRLVLEEKWLGGARLLQDDSSKFFVGTCRYLEKNVELKPHTDQLFRNINKESNIIINEQLAAITYLSMPRDGGELETWQQYPTPGEYESLKGDSIYGIDRDMLPPARVKYKPIPGEMVIINSNEIHAVRPSMDIERISLGCWIGYQDKNKPLVYWS
ncbi:2OG-Fe(II) oxygenase [Vibrio brasiliensis]|uniref:2OG-Fe(II) oxygenase n=1 Tax=Vibrio brasiliensis TaxID=170652 RepID=UPI001EFC51DD|nr:2OG-Fe(II) oxygenase [Vibrio brasiliensis]MCG9724105.1 2OG-Fe(II) oxygenase [Vibrio brasiliensis]